MARAICWALVREDGGSFLAVNAGSDRWNFQIKDLAQRVSELVPDTGISINTNAPPDKRSYRVDFSLYSKLAPDHQPAMELDQAILQLSEGLQGMNFADGDFRESDYMRLKMLESHIEHGRLSAQLKWIRQ